MRGSRRLCRSTQCGFTLIELLVTVSIILILGALSTITPFAIDLYLPAFPQIAAGLGSTEAQVALSLSSYFIGMACGQLFYGPLLDRFGRKKPLYLGLGLFVLATAACAAAQNVETLIWMRLLQEVPGSVLWLLHDNAGAEANLRRAAAARGVNPARLVFAGRVKLDEHLARHRLADLFLDTLPYNAHTTASDALWAGLPLLLSDRVGAAPEVLADGHNGWQFDPSNPAEARDAFLRLLDTTDAGLREAGRRSVQRARERFASGPCVSRFIDDLLRAFPPQIIWPALERAPRVVIFGLGPHVNSHTIRCSEQTRRKAATQSYGAQAI